MPWAPVATNFVAMLLIALCHDGAWAIDGFDHENSMATRVTYITDGDTLWVHPLSGGAPFKVRLEGLDAPEICQAWGPQSRDALLARLDHRSVSVAIHRHDDYGRAVATIALDGEDVADWMVRQGHAWSYRYRRSRGPYAVQEAQARRALRGLFADAAPQYPRDFRRRHGSCSG